MDVAVKSQNIPWSFVKDMPSSKSSSQLSSCSSGGCNTNAIGSRIFSASARGPDDGFAIGAVPILKADVEGWSKPELDVWSM